MKETEINLDVDAIGLDKVKTLIEILSSRISRLDTDLSEAVLSCLDSDVFEYDIDKLCSFGYMPQDLNIIVNGDAGRKGIISANPYLKRILVYPKAFYEDKEPEISNNEFVIDCFYPESFSITDDAGNILVSW